MRRNTFLILLVFLFCNNACNGQSACTLRGDWVIQRGRLFKNYETARSYAYNKIFFSKDSVELSSGFFYNTIDINTYDSRIGRFPFIYYGNKERFKIESDSLYVFSNPYNDWSTFGIRCIDKDRIQLIGKNDSLFLVRDKTRRFVHPCSIQFVKAEVDEGSMSSFNVHYRSTYFPGDSLIFEQMDSLTGNFVKRVIKLRQGTFNQICSGLSGQVDLLMAVRKFPTQEYDFGTIYLQIGLQNGKVINSEIQNSECPEPLWFALIPFLYGHQKLLYSEFPPIKY